MNKIVKEINDEDNIYYHLIESENNIMNLINLASDNPVLSLYVIELKRENLLDKIFDNLNSENILTKHRYCFINKNLPKIHKINLTLKDYEDLKYIKSFFPTINNHCFKFNNTQDQYIITLN
jgi:hypothetical protein